MPCSSLAHAFPSCDPFSASLSCHFPFPFPAEEDDELVDMVDLASSDEGEAAGEEEEAPPSVSRRASGAGSRQRVKRGWLASWLAS